MKEPTVKELRQVITPGRRRELSYHEAGHAVMYFFFCQSIDSINMRGNKRSAAYVRKWKAKPHVMIELYRTSFPPLAKLEAAREIMIYLAGPCAQGIHTQNTDFWFDELFDEWWDVDDPADTCDLSCIMRCAYALHGRTGRASQFVRRMTEWTAEALALPHVWQLVEVLAARLQTQDTMTGNSACKIMSEAWGERGSYPVLNESRKWKRRFNPKLPQLQEYQPSE